MRKAFNRQTCNWSLIRENFLKTFCSFLFIFVMFHPCTCFTMISHKLDTSCLLLIVFTSCVCFFRFWFKIYTFSLTMLFSKSTKSTFLSVTSSSLLLCSVTIASFVFYFVSVVASLVSFFFFIILMIFLKKFLCWLSFELLIVASE